MRTSLVRCSIAAGLTVHLYVAGMDVSTADLFTAPAADLLSGHEASALIQADFGRFDPHYVERQSALNSRLIKLGERLGEIQASGHPMECASEIYLEAKWLQRYTAYWNDLKQRLDDLEKSLTDFRSGAKPFLSISGSPTLSLSGLNNPMTRLCPFFSSNCHSRLRNHIGRRHIDRSKTTVSQ
jgi:hypothetical protein